MDRNLVSLFSYIFIHASNFRECSTKQSKARAPFVSNKHCKLMEDVDMEIWSKVMSIGNGLDIWFLLSALFEAFINFNMGKEAMHILFQ